MFKNNQNPQGQPTSFPVPTSIWESLQNAKNVHASTVALCGPLERVMKKYFVNNFQALLIFTTMLIKLQQITRPGLEIQKKKTRYSAITRGRIVVQYSTRSRVEYLYFGQLSQLLVELSRSICVFDHLFFLNTGLRS